MFGKCSDALSLNGMRIFGHGDLDHREPRLPPYLFVLLYVVSLRRTTLDTI